MRVSRFLPLVPFVVLSLAACTRQAAGRQEPALPGFSFETVATLEEEDPETGLFQLKLHSDRPLEVFYELIDADGTVLTDAVYRVSGETTTLPEPVPYVRAWTTETPELYTLHFQMDGKDAWHPVAFRRVEPLKKDTLVVNGRKVPFKRAGFNPAGLNHSQVLEELGWLKRANVNALNAASLPLPLRELCDTVGFYLYADTLAAPDPASFAVRFAYREVDIQPEDIPEGLFRISNRKQFTSLEDYTVRWWVERDGRRMGLFPRHRLHFSTAPGASETFRLKLPDMEKPGEYRIVFESVLRRRQPLVEKGTVLATEEIVLKDKTAAAPYQPSGTLAVTEGDTRLVIRGKDVEMVFDRAEGTVKSLKVKGKDLLDPAEGLHPVFPEPCRAQCTWSTAEGPVQLQAAYLLPEETRRVRYTLYADGALKVEGPGTLFRFRTQGEGRRYFGRGPDLSAAAAFKSIRKWNGEEGLHPESSWLETGNLTVVGDHPFSFRCQERPEGTETIIGPEKGFVLVPGRNHRKATKLNY